MTFAVSLLPALPVQEDTLPYPPVVAAPFGRERRQQLEQGSLELCAQAQVRQGARHAGNEQGTHLALMQPGELGAIVVDQGAAPARPAIGIDGYAGAAQRLDIAVHCADRHLQLIGQPLCRHPPARLQQHQ